MRHISLDIFSSSFNNLDDFAASISPVTIFRNNDKEGKRNSSKSNLYHCTEVYRNINANLIMSGA